MSLVLSAMRLNTWVAVSLASLLAGGSGFPADRAKETAVNVNFVVENRLSGDEDQAPYYFADILTICSNSRFIYIADWKEAKITILDLDLKFIRRIGRRGQGPGEFSQIFADLACDENRIYLLTINRVYIFTREGDYESEVVLKFIPRRIFPVENGWLFKLDDAEETIWETDWKGDVRSRSIRSAKVLESNCPPMFANPEVYRDSAGRIYLMETKEYRIRRLAAETMTVEKEVKRSVDFDALTCRKVNLGEYGQQYMYTGGFSWLLENENHLLYFFRNSRGGLCVDSYRNDGSLGLNWSGVVRGDFRPLAVIQGGRFLGVSGDEHHVLAVARLMKNAP